MWILTSWALALSCFTTGRPVGPVSVSWEGRGPRWGQQRIRREVCSPHALPSQVLLLCQEGGLKLALNGQGLGATSLGQRALERLRELRVGGGVQLYCVRY